MFLNVKITWQVAVIFSKKYDFPKFLDFPPQIFDFKTERTISSTEKIPDTDTSNI